jgi:hypothetical protein
MKVQPALGRSMMAVGVGLHFIKCQRHMRQGLAGALDPQRIAG